MEQRLSGKYRVWTTATSLVMAATVIAVMAATFGCGGFADQVRSQEASEPDVSAMETATRLYEAMVTVFDADTEGIESTSKETLTVVSLYESMSEQRRRRFVGRIVPVGGGIGVRITAEYQQEIGADGEDPVWEDEPREQVEAEAEPIELSMAREVERTYHRGD